MSTLLDSARSTKSGAPLCATCGERAPWAGGARLCAACALAAELADAGVGPDDPLCPACGLAAAAPGHGPDRRWGLGPCASCAARIEIQRIADAIFAEGEAVRRLVERVAASGTDEQVRWVGSLLEWIDRDATLRDLARELENRPGAIAGHDDSPESNYLAAIRVVRDPRGGTRGGGIEIEADD